MSAQSALGGLSSQCQSSLTSLVTSNFATCSNLLGLVSVASSSGSIVSSLDSYISDLCTSATCSQTTLNNASSTISAGCQSDIASGSTIPVALNTIINNYDDLRGLLCTKYTSNNTYCVTDVLGAVQNSTGTQLSLSTVSSLITGNDYASFLNSIPKSAYCTDCGHAITTEALKIVQNVSASSVDGVKNAASQQCGSSFADGEIPSSVSTYRTSGTASSSSNTGAASPSFHFNRKTLAIIGTISAIIAGVSITM